MTKRECAIVQAYTGVVMLTGDDLGYYFDYIHKLLGYPVWTHELADVSVVRKIQELARPDFKELCRTAVDVREE